MDKSKEVKESLQEIPTRSAQQDYYGYNFHRSLRPNALFTTFNSTTGSYGNMFDIIAKREITLTELGIHSDVTKKTLEYEVYMRDGRYFDCVDNLSCWGEPIALGSVISQGQGHETPVPLTTPVVVDKGQVVAFYVTLVTADLRYSHGTEIDRVFSENNDLKILEGAGIGSYPLDVDTYYEPRVFNGFLHYDVAPWPTPIPSVAPSNDPTSNPTDTPTRTPTVTPTAEPSPKPTVSPVAPETPMASKSSPKISTPPGPKSKDAAVSPVITPPVSKQTAVSPPSALPAVVKSDSVPAEGTPNAVPTASDNPKVPISISPDEPHVTPPVVLPAAVLVTVEPSSQPSTVEQSAIPKTVPSNKINAKIPVPPQAEGSPSAHPAMTSISAPSGGPTIMVSYSGSLDLGSNNTGNASSFSGAINFDDVSVKAEEVTIISYCIQVLHETGKDRNDVLEDAKKSANGDVKNDRARVNSDVYGMKGDHAMKVLDVDAVYDEEGECPTPQDPELECTPVCFTDTVKYTGKLSKPELKAAMNEYTKTLLDNPIDALKEVASETTLTLNGDGITEMSNTAKDFFEYVAYEFLNVALSDSFPPVKINKVKVINQRVVNVATKQTRQRGISFASSFSSSIEVDTLITGEYLPPPDVDFDSVVQDSFDEQGDAFLDQLTAHPAFEGVKGMQAQRSDHELVFEPQRIENVAKKRPAQETSPMGTPAGILLSIVGFVMVGSALIMFLWYKQSQKEANRKIDLDDLLEAERQAEAERRKSLYDDTPNLMDSAENVFS